MRGAAIAVFLVLTGCEMVRVQQSTLVPALTMPPPPREDRVVDVYLEDATVTFLSQPQRAPNSDAGLWVTRHKFQGAVSVHASKHMALRILGYEALSAGAMKAAPTTLQNPGRNTRGVGFGFAASLPVGSPATQLHIVTDLVFAEVPSYVRRVCEDCEDPSPQRGRIDVDPMAIASLCLFGSHRVAPGTRLRLGAGVVNHPANLEEFNNDAVVAEINDGPVNGVLSLGVEVDLDWVSLAPQIQWPVTRDPVVYGPIVGLGVRAGFER